MNRMYNLSAAPTGSSIAFCTAQRCFSMHACYAPWHVHAASMPPVITAQLIQSICVMFSPQSPSRCHHRRPGHTPAQIALHLSPSSLPYDRSASALVLAHSAQHLLTPPGPAPVILNHYRVRGCPESGTPRSQSHRPPPYGSGPICQLFLILVVMEVCVSISLPLPQKHVHTPTACSACLRSAAAGKDYLFKKAQGEWIF